MHRRQQIFRAQRPSFREHAVVDVLKTDSRNLPENIQSIQFFLKVEQANVPRPSLLFDDVLQGGRCASMASSRVKKDKVTFSFPSQPNIPRQSSFKQSVS